MIDRAIEYLKEHDIESFELSGVLVIPVSSANEILPMVSNVKAYLKDISYNKSWAVDPYFYEKRGKIEHDLFGDNLKTDT